MVTSSAFRVAAASSASTYLLFWFLVLRARLGLGFWPYLGAVDPLSGTHVPSPIDPKEFPVHSALVWLGLEVSIAMLLVALVLLIVQWIHRPFRPSLELAVSCTIPASMWGLLLFDPGGFFLWFMD